MLISSIWEKKALDSRFTALLPHPQLFPWGQRGPGAESTAAKWIYSQQSEDVMKVLPLKNVKIVTSQNRATKTE